MIGFRVDANEIIATGHLMRCISIAEQVRKLGEDIHFFLAEDKCTELLSDRNIEYTILDSDWRNMGSELEGFIPIILSMELEWLVIDSYQKTGKYLSELRSVTKVMAIDLDEDQIYDVDAILNYSNIECSAKLRELYKGTDVILMDNLKYAPLREQFAQENNIFRKRQIMITTGGTDPYHVALNVTKEILKDSRLNQYDICVVLGRMCTDRDAIEKLDESRVTVLQNVSNMAEIMRSSEVCFTAGGSTVLELCACQTPAVVFSFADNQIPFSEVLAEYGALEYIGDIRELNCFTKVVVDRICKILFEINYKETIIGKLKGVCDGCGANRIAYTLTVGDKTNHEI